MPPHSFDRIIQRDVVTCSLSTSTLDATRLMYERHCSSIIVVDNGRPIGIWTEADSLKIDILNSNQFTRPIGQIMTAKPFTISRDVSLDEAASLLKNIMYVI